LGIIGRKNCGHYRFGRVVGVKVGVAILFSGQSIGIDETSTTVKIFSCKKIMVASGLGGLWTLAWAWQTFFWVRFLRFVGIKKGVANFFLIN